MEGNRRIDAETVRSYFHAAPDGHFDDAARDAALKALMATGLFDKVTIERAGERLVVHLTEAPVLDRVAFEGNKKIKDTELAAVVESKPRGSLQRATVQADVGRIIEAYRHAGRYEVSVDAANHRPRQWPGRSRLRDNGGSRRRTVRQIDFIGNKVFGKRQLSRRDQDLRHHMLSFLTGGDVYDPDRVAQDQEQLRLYYRSKGYADVSVTSAKAEYDPATKGFTLTLCNR